MKLIKGKRAKKIKIDSLFAAVKAMAATGDERAFLRKCREKDLRISASPELINLLKEHLPESNQTVGGKARAALVPATAATGAGGADPSMHALARRLRECDDVENC